MGIYGTVFLILLVLKLTAVAQLSWLVVFSPILIGICITLIIVALASLLGVDLKAKK